MFGNGGSHSHVLAAGADINDGSERRWAGKSRAKAAWEVEGGAHLFFSILGCALRPISGVVTRILCLGNLLSSVALDVACCIINIAAGERSSTVIYPKQTCIAKHMHYTNDRPVDSADRLEFEVFKP